MVRHSGWVRAADRPRCAERAAVSTLAPRPSMVRVLIGEREIELAPGDELAFGRAPGPGHLSLSPAVSKVHGVVRAGEGMWSVVSTGTYHGFTVLDGETPSRLVIPKGAGPVAVPFARAVIAVEVEHHRCVLEVDARHAGAPGWEGAWVSYLNREPASTLASGTGTNLAWAGARFVDRAGRPLKWYQVLVAMCEPRLRLPASEREDRIPSNREIAQRLGVSVGVIENHHLDRLRRELGFPRFSEQMRLGAVLLAISQGIVTTADLPLLDLDGSDPPDGAGVDTPPEATT